MSPLFPERFLAADPFEALIEDRIVGPRDLYDLDGETFLRSRDGRIETGDFDLLFEGGR